MLLPRSDPKGRAITVSQNGRAGRDIKAGAQHTCMEPLLCARHWARCEKYSGG